MELLTLPEYRKEEGLTTQWPKEQTTIYTEN
jgi:hypothetical protein